MARTAETKIVCDAGRVFLVSKGMRHDTGLRPFLNVLPWRRFDRTTNWPDGWVSQRWVSQRRRHAAGVGRAWAELKRAKASGDDASLREAIGWATALCDSEQRLGRLVYATFDVKPEIFWPAWFETWPSVDYSAEYHGILPFLFRSKGSALRYLNKKQRAQYDALPRKVTVYRGCDCELQYGVSWTTRRKVAQYFAGGGRYGPPDDPVIVKGVIDKRSPNFFFCVGDARSEAEIVCLPDKIVSVTSFRKAAA